MLREQKTFPVVKWGTQMVVKSELAEGETDVVDLSEEAKDADEEESEDSEVEVVVEEVEDEFDISVLYVLLLCSSR